VRAGAASLCPGQVWHRRLRPTTHEFLYPVRQVWIDPDRPDELFGRSSLWSSNRPRPVRFRTSDYGDERPLSLAEQARTDLSSALGHYPVGAVRMLSQPRRWGWLFNPITLFFVWDDDPDRPVGVVLEVTNTPWKERHRYGLLLEADVDGWQAEFNKELHVSPFLSSDVAYRLKVTEPTTTTLAVNIDVIDDEGESIVQTALTVERRPASKSALSREALRLSAPTHRVTLGIHLQAARLILKRVPFVPHPKNHQGATT
jgi:DUF1365 family protein